MIWKSAICLVMAVMAPLGANAGAPGSRVGEPTGGRSGAPGGEDYRLGEDLFRYGMLRGAKDASKGRDFGPAMAKNLGDVPLYGFGGIDLDLDAMGVQLIQRLIAAPPHLRLIYYKAFVAGYQLGHSLNPPREQHAALLSLDHLLRIGIALRSYAFENNGKMPPMESTASLRHAVIPVGKGVTADDFVDPFTKQPYQFNSSLVGKTWLDLKSHAPQTVFAYEGSVAPDGTRGVLFITGEARRVTKAEWERLKKQSGIRTSRQTNGH